jgi:hypothetical protein
MNEISHLKQLLTEAHIALAMVRDNETAMPALRPSEQAMVRKMYNKIAVALFGEFTPTDIYHPSRESV